ncbi:MULTISPECIES: type II toxin-antitoxin system prevent-host-death family antitoxin [Pantoea]|nr:type II toxin-antitoxin system prevent-host-death family antitoxin [Pantoea agglomerans]
MTANQAKRRFGELISKAQHEAVTLTQNGRTAFICLPARVSRL